MKSIQVVFLIIFISIAVIGVAIAQMNPIESVSGKSSGSIPLGVGATFIDKETFYLVNFEPEVAFGNLGIGLDVNLRFSTSGKLRAEYNRFEDYLRVIRYVRWAQKGDPFYIRVGQLDYSRLGHGFIIYYYRNSSSYDLRKTGMELDLNFEKYGFESMVSDFAHAGIIGVRGYVRPLKFTSLEKIPVINNFEVGVTFATDRNDSASKTYNPSTSTISTYSSLSIYGFDLGLPIISYHIFKSSIYADYAKIIHFGNGATVGIDMHLSVLGLATISGKYERRFNGDRFIPSYFNALYERDRFSTSAGGKPFYSKADSLQYIKKNQGYYGDIVINVLNMLNIIGGYQAPVNVKNEGIFHAEINMGEVLPSILLAGGYDRKNIGQLLKLDENSILYSEIGYKPMPYLVVSTLYQWTWTLENGIYKTQKRIEPKVSLVFNF